MWPDLLTNENKKAFVLHLYTQYCTSLWTNINWPIFLWGFSVPIQTNTVNKYNVLKKSQVAGVRPVGYSQSRARELNSREPRKNPVSSTMTFGPFSHVNISSKKAFVSKCFFVIFPRFECFEIWSPKLALTILFLVWEKVDELFLSHQSLHWSKGDLFEIHCVLSFSKVFNREKTTAPQATFTLFSCSPNFSRASYPQARALAYEPIIKLYLICNNG